MKDFLIGAVLGLAMLALGAVLMWLVLFASVRKAHAFEVFVEGGVGVSLNQFTTPDGVWIQQPFPNSRDMTSLAWKAGLGVQLTEHWSVTGSYVSLGESRATTEFVSDHNYDYGDRTGPRNTLTATDALSGPQLVAAYRWTQWPVQPFLSGGVAVLHHYGAAWDHRYANAKPFEFHGDIPMLVAGGGLCYRWLCGEVTYYRGVQAPNYPISTSTIVPMVSVKYTF
jgi:hypothetical protein